MFEDLLEKILRKFFGDYIENLDHENLHVGVLFLHSPKVWSGNVKLENVNLKKSILRQLRLPFALKFGKIKLLNVFPKRNAIDSSALEKHSEQPSRNPTRRPLPHIQYNSPSTIAPQRQDEWEIMDTVSPRAKQEALEVLAEESLQKIEQKVKESADNGGKMGFWERIMAKVIDNLQVTIRWGCERA
eukprot:TRINITY_DN10768_c0_g3_i1.p1 TRINITY_DN10768_c0_g3~~TRINITY_DN10768_c0_g3_i1.p1  ORF type:complete len:187 (+),score=50.98 TRINITY_DN10768_c0_g3_i1:183-743(+)